MNDNGVVPRFVTMTIMSFIIVFSIQFIAPILSLFALTIDVSTTLLAAILSVTFFIQIFLRPLSGRAGDLLGKLRLIPFAIFFYSLGQFLLFLTQNPIEFFIARLLISIGASFFWPNAVAYVSNLAKKDKLGTTLGALWAFVDVASVIGPSLGGYFSEIFGYRFLFLVNGTFILISGTVFLVTLKYFDKKYNTNNLKSAGKFSFPKFKSELISGVRVLLRNSAVRLALFSVIVVSMCVSTFATFYPILTKFRGLSETEIGETQSGKNLIKLFLRLPGGRLSDKYGPGVILITSTLSLGISMTLLSVATTFFEFLILMMVIGISTGIFLPTVQALLLGTVNEEEHGLAMGVWGAILNMSKSIGLAIIGIIVYFFSVELIFLVFGVLTLIGTIPLIVSIKKIREIYVQVREHTSGVTNGSEG